MSLSSNLAVERNIENTSSGDGLDALYNLVKKELGEVNQLLLERMDSSVSLIPELAGHLITAGGKRIRSMLTVASAKLFGYEGHRHVDLAACVEFIHTATLLHDDVVDESDLRRGLTSAHKIWGNKASVLVGDFLFSRSFQLMVRDGDLRALKVLSDASSTIIEGEVLQLLSLSNFEATEEAYLKVIKAKTAKLFAAGCQIGALVANRSAAEEEALRNYGHNIGMLFQFIDDVLDYTADQKTLGKTIGDDFREGKLTIPVIIAFEQGTNTEKEFWIRTMMNHEQKEGDFGEALQIIEKRQALTLAIQKASVYASRAKQNLMLFPAGEVRTILENVVDFCESRVY